MNEPKQYDLRAGDIVQITDPFGLCECCVQADSGAQFAQAFVIPTAGGSPVWIEKDKIVAVRRA